MAGLPGTLNWIEFLARMALGGVFLVAGILKVLDPGSLLAATETYQIIPYHWSYWLALYLPWVEVLAGLGILLRKAYPGSLFLVTALLVVFLIALIQAWARGLNIICGCFSQASAESTGRYVYYVARDLSLLGLAGFLWWRHLGLPFPLILARGQRKNKE